MLEPLLQWLERWTTTRPRLVAGVVLVIALLLGSRVPTLQSDPAPQGLVANFEGQDRFTAELAEVFGAAEDHLLLVLVEADDVFSAPVLSYVQRLSRRLAALPEVARVDSLTHTPLPHASDRAVEVESDDELERELLGQSAKPAVGSTPATKRPDALADLGAARVQPIVSADPLHFPRGISSLSERAESSGLTSGPLMAGESPTADEIQLMRRLGASPALKGRLVGQNGKLLALVVRLDPAQKSHAEMGKGVKAVKSVLEELPPPANVSRHLAGLPHLRQEIVRLMQRDQLILTPATLLLSIALLALAFRWWPAVLSPIAAVAVTALCLLGAMALCSVPMNILNNILPALLIIIGISDGIHLVARYRQEIEQGKDREAAGRATVRSMALACFLTSLTTAIGFSSLAATRTPMLHQFGLVAASGVMIAYVATILLLPALLVLAKPPSLTVVRAGRRRLEGLMVWLTRALIRHPWPVLGATLVCFLLAVYGANRLVIDVKLLDQFDERHDVYVATRLADEQLSGSRPLEIVLKSSEPGRFHDPKLMNAIAELEEFARQQPGVLGSEGPPEVLHEVWALLAGSADVQSARFVNREQVAALAAVAEAGASDALKARLNSQASQARVTIYLSDAGARASMRVIDALERRLSSKLAPLGKLQFELCGEAYTSSRGLDAVVRDIFSGLMGATVVIFVILALLFRSLRLGLLAIPPNIVPIVGTMGYMALRGIPLTTATVIIFSVSIGLAVDGSIHVIARYREERQNTAFERVALLRSLRGTGRAVAVTCVTLALGFSVLLLSSFVPVRQFGELIAVTVAMCLIGTLVVQPALLRVGLPAARRGRPNGGGR